MNANATEAELARLLEEVEERDEHLSAWERTFLDSIQDWVARGVTLSEAQEEKLREIHGRVCP